MQAVLESKAKRRYRKIEILKVKVKMEIYIE